MRTVQHAHDSRKAAEVSRSARAPGHFGHPESAYSKRSACSAGVRENPSSMHNTAGTRTKVVLVADSHAEAVGLAGQPLVVVQLIVEGRAARHAEPAHARRVVVAVDVVHLNGVAPLGFELPQARPHQALRGCVRLCVGGVVCMGQA